MIADDHYCYPSVSTPTSRAVFSFLFSNQNFGWIFHCPKSNNPLIFLITLNESPSHTTFSILFHPSHSTPPHYSPLLPNSPPKSHPLAHKHAKPFIQPPCLFKQDILHYVNLSLSYLPLLSASITIYIAVSARIALRSLWAAPSTSLFTAHGFLNLLNIPPFARLKNTINSKVQTDSYDFDLLCTPAATMNRTRNDMNGR